MDILISEAWFTNLAFDMALYDTGTRLMTGGRNKPEK